MSLSKRISDLRQKKGLKQSEIANLVELSQSSYSRIENNPDTLTLEQLEKIANALDTTLVELITGEPPKEDDQEKITELEARINELEGDKEYLQASLKTKDSLIKFQLRSISQAVSAWKEIYEVITTIKPDETIVFDQIKLASLGVWLDILSSLIEDIENKK